MKFNDAESFIKWVEVQKRFSKKVSLDKMKYYLSLFDHPENKFKSIHITGTNGKGSTVAMLKAILMDKGLNVATFTSPYITCFNERIGFNDKYISDNDLVLYANLIIEKYPKIEKDQIELPTFFEFITILAFLYFANITNLDIALIEVGMGGKLDSTNVITPILSIITNVAYDHMHVLGNTLSEILENKLGIVKRKIPLVSGITDEKLVKQISSYCNQNISTYKIIDKSKINIKNLDINGSTFDYKNYKNIELSLVGFHQIENATVVIDAFDIIKNNFNLSIDNLYNGLKNVKWPGRLELISKKPCIFVDGAHNIDGITRLCEFVKTLNNKYKRAIVSISHDKEIKDMIKLIDETFDEIVFTKYTYARSANVTDLYNSSNSKNKLIINNVEDALDYALNDNIDITFIIGSLYLVSEVKNLMIKKEK